MAGSPRRGGAGGRGSGRASMQEHGRGIPQQAAVDLVQPLAAVPGPDRHRMDGPGCPRPGAWWVRHRARPLQGAGPAASTTPGSGKVRIAPPTPRGEARPGEGDRHGEAHDADCVRIVHLIRNSLDLVSYKDRKAV